jgi:hypothetical protein
MRKKEGKMSPYILALLMLGALALVFQLGAVCAIAQDQDQDGFSDSLEGAGFTFINGLTLEATGQAGISPCTTGPRDQCVDSTKEDYFVIIKRATNPCPNPTSCGDPCGPPMFNNATTNIAPYSQYLSIYGTTYGPLEWVPLIETGFATHSLLQNPTNAGQQVAASGWYAVKIVEDLNPCSSWMGLSVPGTITPTAPGSATVWTEKIKNWIDKACSQACFTDKTGNKTCYYVSVPDVPVPPGYLPAPGKFTCTNGYNTNMTPIDMTTIAGQQRLPLLYHDFIKNVISHEASHMMHLAFGDGTTADNHWQTLQGVLMEQNVVTKATKDKKGNIAVTINISTEYTRQDPGQHALQ